MEDNQDDSFVNTSVALDYGLVNDRGNQQNALNDSQGALEK